MVGMKSYDNSREDTIKALSHAMKPEQVDKEAIRDINSMWIPVEVRTPSYDECKRSNGNFLVSRSDGGIYIDRFIYEGNGYSPKGFYIKDSSEVVAWMNLPEPYMV